MVYLITGKAGAGKSTYAKRLEEELLSEGKDVLVLDSDELRKRRRDFDFSDEGRFKHLTCLAEAAAVVEGYGSIAIIAAISPRKDWRKKMRAHWKKSILVYLPGGNLWDGTEYERPDYDELLPA